MPCYMCHRLSLVATMRCWLTSVALRLLRFCVACSVEGLINQCEDLTRDLSEFRDLEFKMWKEDMTDALSVRGGKEKKNQRAPFCFSIDRCHLLHDETVDRFAKTDSGLTQAKNR
eukprot:COSAG06_NODE_6260_length_3009_cov_7.058559_6_plen_115_part_00